MSIIAPLNPVERRDATQATKAAFEGRPFSFADGVTCIHLLRAQMVAFGYSPPPIPEFKDALGAKRALRKMGHRTLKGLLNKMLTPIPPAQMRVGDVALLPGEAPFDSVVISAGGKVLGFHEQGNGLVNIIPTALFIGAWRLI